MSAPLAAPRLAAVGRRRKLPHLLLGVLLVVACGAVSYLGSARASGRVPVLAVARDVAAGQVLTAADVRVVRVAAGTDVATIPAGDAQAVVGAIVAMPRPAGALLSPADVGAPGFPPEGKAVAAVALKAGQFPPDLTAGTKVAALIPPSEQPAATRSGKAGGSGTSTGAAAGARSAWLPGVVMAVGADSSGTGVTVVSLLMDQNAASAVGAAGAASANGAGNGAVSLVLLPPGTDVEGG